MLCECGCGQPPKPAVRNDKKRGWTKGQPVRFIHNHKQRLRSPEHPAMERFWEKVDKTRPDGCWVWTSFTARGYGRFQVGSRKDGTARSVRAHRFAYELTIGPIPDGTEIDHLCRNKACVNPAHLEAVDHRTNVLRGEGVAAQRARAAHCIHGHAFDMMNTRQRANGSRVCRACEANKSHKAAANAHGGFVAETLEKATFPGRAVGKLVRAGE